MKKFFLLSLLFALVATTGSTCKKSEAPSVSEDAASAPPAGEGPAPQEAPSAAPEQAGSAAAPADSPANDEKGMGESEGVKDNGQTHED